MCQTPRAMHPGSVQGVAQFGRTQPGPANKRATVSSIFARAIAEFELQQDPGSAPKAGPATPPPSGGSIGCADAIYDVPAA